MSTSPPPRSSAGDMLFGMGAKLLYAATRVALPPLALAHMGLADYGLWAACFVLVGYLGMAASGFTLVYLRRTAQLHAVGDLVGIGRLLSTGMLAMGALALLLLAALWLLLPALLELFRVAPAQRPLAALLWLGAAAVFLADMSLGAFANVLHALGRVRQEQQVWVLAFLLETALIATLLHLGWGAAGLLAAFCARYAFSAAANAWLACRALPGLRLHWRGFDRSLLRSFFGFGAGMQASGLLATALHSADRLLAGALIGPQATALVDLAAKVPTTAASISSGASGVAVSATARHEAQGHLPALRQVYRDASRITCASLAMSLPFIVWFASPLASAWLGPGTVPQAVAPLMAGLALALHLHMLTGPATAVSRGRGRLDADFTYHAMRAALLGAAALGWCWLGGTTLPSLVAAIVLAQAGAALLFIVLAHHRLGEPLRALAARVGAPTLAAYALAGLLHLAWPVPAGTGRWQAAQALALLALAWLPAAAALMAGLMLDGAERRALRLRLLNPPIWRRA